MQSVLTEVKRVNNILDNYELPSGEDDCENKIEELSEIRERLVQYGFNKPFVPYSFRTHDEMPHSELKEIKKQLKEFRYVAYLKKSTLKRVDHAMAAYKIAQLHFKSGALVNAYRHLPYDGNLVWRISKYGATAARLYFDIYELLSGELEQLGISVDIAVPSEKGVKYEKLQLYGIKDVDDYVNEAYGRDAEIVKTKIITRHRSMLTSKAYRKVLACAYAVNSMSSASVPTVWEDEKHELLQKYLHILRKHGIKEIVKIDVIPELKEEMITELQKEMLVYFDTKGEMFLDNDLNLKLNEIMSKRYWEYAKDAYGKMAVDMVRMIILTTKATRKSMGVFSFDDDHTLISPVMDKAGLAGIIKVGEMIKDKYRLEEALGAGSRELGLAVFAHYQGRKKLKEIFNVEFRNVEKEYLLVKTYLEGHGGRGDKFLEQLKR